MNMDLIKRKKMALIFLTVGAIGGFLYWKFVGCTSGTCLIKSVWYWSSIWGAAFGYVVGDIINDFILKRKKRGEKHDRKI